MDDFSQECYYFHRFYLKRQKNRGIKMLINLTLENWMSFQNPVSFSMLGSKEAQHNERLPRVKKYNIKVLPIAAIFGGNASGKTNFFKALYFVKNLVTYGTHPDGLIAVDLFKLDKKSLEKPVRFSFELLIDEIIFEFSFAVTRQMVLEEKLVKISSSGEKTLYHRIKGKPNFHKSFEKDQFLKFAFNGTRDNQLFLTNSVSQKVDAFKPIYDWFNDLMLIAPDSRFGSFENFFGETSPVRIQIDRLLSQFDTGIQQLDCEDIPFEHLALPSEVIAKLQEQIKEGMSAKLMSRNEWFFISRKKGNLVATKLVSYHLNSDDTKIKFEIYQESDGTQRVIDLLPAFLEATTNGSKKVWIIDEFDRCLHSLLSRRLLEMYLASCSDKSRSQVLLTTHDALLMDQKLLRRDEMWVTERSKSGASRLFSFSEYKAVRYDKDVRKSYLSGRLGGIPHLSAQQTFAVAHK